MYLLEGGASATWEAVYREHVIAVYRFAFARTGNRPDAEDVTSNVFLRALRRLRTDASAGEVRAYLLQTARTVLADHWTVRYGAPAVGLDDERVVASAPDSRNQDRGVRQAASLLAGLPEMQRRVLELRFLRGLSVRETAAELGISVGNARVVQHRALRHAAAIAGRAGP